MSDLIGQRFGRLVVIEKTSKDKHGYMHYLCKCDCGNIKDVSSCGLNRGSTRSCGCLRREIAKDKAIRLLDQTKHGKHNTRLYHIYNGMKARCYNPNNPKFKNYGNRGIVICDEWLDSFQAFYDWAIDNGYRDDLTIDRIDVNGNYEPSNCRWTNNIVQGNNRTNNTIYDFRGIKHTQKEWAEILGCHRCTIIRAIKKGLTFEEFVMKHKAGAKVVELLQKG